MPKNTAAAKSHYRKAMRSIRRLSVSTRKDQTTLAIIKHLKAAIAADGGN